MQENVLARIRLTAPFQMPDVHEALDRLSGKKYYSSVDFTAWFQQFEIAKEDRDKVAFIIPGDNLTPPQIYQWKRMCFGLLNAGYWSRNGLVLTSWRRNQDGLK